LRLKGPTGDGRGRLKKDPLRGREAFGMKVARKKLRDNGHGPSHIKPSAFTKEIKERRGGLAPSGEETKDGATVYALKKEGKSSLPQGSMWMFGRG